MISLTIILFLTKSVFAAEPAYHQIHLPKLAELGFKMTQEDLPSGSTLVVTQDLQTHYKFISQYSPLRRLEWSELRSPGGALLERTEVEPHKQITSIYDEKLNQTILSRTNGKLSFASNGKSKELTDSSFLSWCEENPYDFGYFLKKDEWMSNRALNNILNNKKVLVFAENDEDHNRIGMNTKLNSCEDYPRGGVSGLAGDLQKSVDQGLSCLGKKIPEFFYKNSGSFCNQKVKKDSKKCVERIDRHLVRLRYEAIRVIEMFTFADSFKINCKSNWSVEAAGLKLANPDATPGAMALICSEDPKESPGMDIFLDGMKKLKKPNVDNASKAQGILFHEMMHIVGLNNYPHEKPINYEYDVPYLIENCCFMDSKSACRDLINNDHVMPDFDP